MAEFLKSENSEVILNVVDSIVQVAKTLKEEFFQKDMITTLTSLTKNRNWRVAEAVFKLYNDLGLMFGK